MRLRAKTRSRRGHAGPGTRGGDAADATEVVIRNEARQAQTEAEAELERIKDPKLYVVSANALRSADRTLIETGRSFGCGRWALLAHIRLPNAMLRTFFKKAKVGTDVYVFESQEPVTGGGQVEP